MPSGAEFVSADRSSAVVTMEISADVINGSILNTEI